MLIPVLSSSRLIKPPAAFGAIFTPSFKVFLRGQNYSTDYNIQLAKPAYGGTIYCGAGGNNANTGLTYPLRVRSWGQAVSRANALATSLAVSTIRIVIDDGLYKVSTNISGVRDSWNGIQPTCSLVIEVNQVNGIGRAVSVIDTAIVLPAFIATTDPNIYASTYTTSAPSQQIVDMANPDPDGSPTMQAQVRTVANPLSPYAELNAAWALYGLGASYVDLTNKVIWVRRFNNAAPDANMIVLGNSSGGGIQAAAASALSIWMENCAFWGAGGGAAPFEMHATATFSLNLWANNCRYVGGMNGNAFVWTGGGGNCIQVNCAASYADMDGFNYHGTTNFPHFVEIGCNSRWNGWDNGGLDNGTTCHNSCMGVTVGGGAYNSSDRSVNDVDTSARWILGTKASCRRGLDATENSAAFAQGNGVGTSTGNMYLDGCQVVANYAGQMPQYPFEAYNGATLHYTRMASIIAPAGNPGAGTFTRY